MRALLSLQVNSDTRRSAGGRTDVLGARDGGFLFIDNARFLSILAIVLRHTDPFESSDAGFSLLATLLIQFRSFGVIIFFVVSGFLMSLWLGRPGASPAVYARNRVMQLGRPWLLWMAVYLGLDLLKLLGRGTPPSGMVQQHVINDIFFDSYWFVPALLLAVLLLLGLKRHWDSPWLGGVLCFCSILHGVDRYVVGFEIPHTIAFTGYFAYVWLGIYLHRHFAAVQQWIERRSWPVVWTMFGAAFLLMLGESHWLLQLGNPNPYNILNPATQLYALVCLGVLIKIRTNLVPRFVDVRKETFGIYLLHQPIASVGRGLLDLLAGIHKGEPTLFVRMPDLIASHYLRLLVWLAWFGAIYLLSLFCTKTILATSLAWTVGGRRSAMTNGRSTVSEEQLAASGGR